MRRGISVLLAVVCGIVASAACATCAAGAAAPGRITVDVGHPGPKLDPLFYGLMTEEINHSYDGGLYAELIQNRTFRDDDDGPAHWSIVQGGGAAGRIALDAANPVNADALKTSLRLDIDAPAGDGGRVGVASGGYWGIPVWPNTKYRASFYARASEGFAGPLRVSIEGQAGGAPVASAEVPAVNAEWKKYEVSLSTGQVPTSTANAFVISAGPGAKGSVWFSLVSLFPPTYNDRPNGNRVDLMRKLAALHPKFLRFPGGNYLEGDEVETRFQWKKTLGALEERPGHMGCWGYRSSDGLGLLEFLEWCEDLKVEPILAVYAGYSLHGAVVLPGKDLEPFAQEALDEVEYVTGDASTTWGGRRARDGHPEPFKLRYVEVGNEDGFDKSKSYDGRFTQFFDAIKSKYPDLQCIATASVRTRKPDLVDDHSYLSAFDMLRAVRRYDGRDPALPRVFFGEWATQDGKPTPTLRAALSDAAWLTGLQADCDKVLMNCYAPLLVNVNRGASQWPTNLIGYDAAASFGSPSYYAQAMFAEATGDTVLPAEVVPQSGERRPPLPAGAIGVGTWRTAAEFKDVAVTSGDKVLFRSDPKSDLADWHATNGEWSVKDGVFQQGDVHHEAWITTGDDTWRDYSLRLKVRKLRGDEGFLVLYHVRSDREYSWFNVGGWTNTQSNLEQFYDDGPRELGASSEFNVQNERWYDVRIEVKGRLVKAYIDDKLISQAFDGMRQPAMATALFAAASRVDATGEIILKVVNAGAGAQQLAINLAGVKSVANEARAVVLTGQPGDVNTLAQPTKVAPVSAPINGAGPNFSHTFPAHSVTVIRLQTK